MTERPLMIAWHQAEEITVIAARAAAKLQDHLGRRLSKDELKMAVDAAVIYVLTNHETRQ